MKTYTFVDISRHTYLMFFRALLFMKPFKWEVWLSLLILISFLGPLLLFLTVKSLVSDSNIKHKRKGPLKVDIAVLIVFKAFLSQGEYT